MCHWGINCTENDSQAQTVDMHAYAGIEEGSRQRPCESSHGEIINVRGVDCVYTGSRICAPTLTWATMHIQVSWCGLHDGEIAIQVPAESGSCWMARLCLAIIRTTMTQGGSWQICSSTHLTCLTLALMPSASTWSTSRKHSQY